jgi:HEPN/Toprim N-terminal domain 1
MTSSCELKFDNLFICSQKEFVPDDLIYLFQEGDRREVANTDQEHGELSIGYFADRRTILKRLDLGGYTADAAQLYFNEWLTKKYKDFESYAEEGDNEDSSELTALKQFSYEEWKSRVKEVLHTRFDLSSTIATYRDKIDERMRDFNEDWLFYGGDDGKALLVIRSMLEALPDVQEISLDIGPLIYAGWLERNDRICVNRKLLNFQKRSLFHPPVIIAEGSTDITVLKTSLQKLHPELIDYISFFDYDVRVDGGTSYIVKFLRAFAAARINTKILAIFDNDAAGVAAFKDFLNQPLPKNIRAMCLPDISIAQDYPTIGPQGNHLANVNGRAVSIELFLGRHNLLEEDGSLTPIFWSSYEKKVNTYQGAIENKSDIRKRFLQNTKPEQSIADYRNMYPELATLWDHILKLLIWDD